MSAVDQAVAEAPSVDEVARLSDRLLELDETIAEAHGRLEAIPAELHEARMQRERRGFRSRLGGDRVAELEFETAELEERLAEAERDREAVVQALAEAEAEERVAAYAVLVAELRDVDGEIVAALQAAAGAFSELAGHWERLYAAGSRRKDLRIRARNELNENMLEADFASPVQAFPDDLRALLVLLWEHGVNAEGRARGRDPILRERLPNLTHLREQRISLPPVRSFSRRNFT